MAFELNHIFICASIGAGEADLRIAFGLTEGTPNVHQGQRTARRRFFFRNAYLELLWVENSVEAQVPLDPPRISLGTVGRAEPAERVHSVSVFVRRDGCRRCAFLGLRLPPAVSPGTDELGDRDERRCAF